MKQFVAITKALACEKRLRILMALRHRELCEGTITEMIGLAPATASRHLWLLQQAGLVNSEKTGRCVCYRLATARRSSVTGRTLRWLRECLARHPQIVLDTTQAQALYDRSSVQAECRERRRKMATRWSQITLRSLRMRGANTPTR